MKYFYIVWVMILTDTVKAQIDPITPRVGGITLRPLTTTGRTIDESNIFFIETWNEGRLFINVDDAGLYVSQLKYNIAEDKLLMRNEQGIFEFPKGSLLSFTLKSNGREYTFISGLEGIQKYNATNFFLVYYNSKKIKLVTKHYAILQNLGSNNYGSTTQEYTYTKDKELYIYKGGKGISIKRNKKSILEALGGDKKMWDEYIKSNKLDLKREEDVARLIQYYDSKNLD